MATQLVPPGVQIRQQQYRRYQQERRKLITHMLELRCYGLEHYHNPQPEQSSRTALPSNAPRTAQTDGRIKDQFSSNHALLGHVSSADVPAYSR